MAKKEIQQSFEESIEELDFIVRTMEEEQLPLEKLISNYERGAALHLHCETFLNSAKQRLEKIANTKAISPPTEQASSNDDDDIRLF